MLQRTPSCLSLHTPPPAWRPAPLRTSRSPCICTASLQGGAWSPVNLPGGGGVWLGPSSSKESFLPGPGYTFLILRDRVGGEGLVVRPPGGPKPLHVRRQQAAGGGQLAPRRAPLTGGLSLVGLDFASSVVVIDTEFELVEEQQQPAVIEPNTTCTGIVPLSWLAEEEQEQSESASKHPRRTQRVRFTCNLCGTSNEKETNPHAWQHGSVFMRCEGCSAVHKVRDNLRIFHEVRGPIFPPRHLRNSFLVQEILDKIDTRRRGEQGEEGGLLN